MKKQLISLLLVLVLGLGLTIPAAMAGDDTDTTGTAGYYYVYTENGKGLNVRATPGGEIVGSLKYGTRVYCYYRDGGNGWALIDYSYDMKGVGYGTYACFISSRYLRKNKPEPRSASKTSADTAATTDVASEINAEFRSAKRVTPFSVTVRPSRAGGWVNMRWAPSKSAEIMATYKSNEKLLVIRELDNWYQVEDQDTGDVGFISKQYVVQ